MADDLTQPRPASGAAKRGLLKLFALGKLMNMSPEIIH